MKCFVEQQKPFVPGIWGNLQLTSQRLAQQKVESNTFCFTLIFSVYSLAFWLPHDSRIPHVLFLANRIDLFLFLSNFQGKFSAMLFDRFICPARSVSQFWLLEDGWSCVTGLKFTNNRAEVSHVDFYLESFRILGYFRWKYDRLGSQEALQQLKAAGFEVRTNVGLVGVFKNMNNTAVSQNSLSHSMKSIDFLVFETSPFPRIQCTKFFPFWLHPPMCPASCGDFSAGKLQVKHRRPAEFLRSLGKSQSFSRVFLWSLQSLHFNFFNAMDVGGCWSTLVHKKKSWIESFKDAQPHGPHLFRIFGQMSLGWAGNLNLPCCPSRRAMFDGVPMALTSGFPALISGLHFASASVSGEAFTGWEIRGNIPWYCHYPKKIAYISTALVCNFGTGWSNHADYAGPTKGELCRQLGVVVLVDDQLQNILDAVSHGGTAMKNLDNSSLRWSDSNMFFSTN